MIGHNYMYEATLFKMYMVDKNSNIATKVVSNISKMINKQSSTQKENKKHTVSLKVVYK
jgi:hypothetical protein